MIQQMIQQNTHNLYEYQLRQMSLVNEKYPGFIYINLIASVVETLSSQEHTRKFDLLNNRARRNTQVCSTQVAKNARWFQKLQYSILSQNDMLNLVYKITKQYMQQSKGNKILVSRNVSSSSLLIKIKANQFSKIGVLNANSIKVF